MRLLYKLIRLDIKSFFRQSNSALLLISKFIIIASFIPLVYVIGALGYNLPEIANSIFEESSKLKNTDIALFYVLTIGLVLRLALQQIGSTKVLKLFYSYTRKQIRQYIFIRSYGNAFNLFDVVFFSSFIARLLIDNQSAAYILLYLGVFGISIANNKIALVFATRFGNKQWVPILFATPLVAILSLYFSGTIENYDWIVNFGKACRENILYTLPIYAIPAIVHLWYVRQMKQFLYLDYIVQPLGKASKLFKSNFGSSKRWINLYKLDMQMIFRNKLPKRSFIGSSIIFPLSFAFLLQFAGEFYSEFMQIFLVGTISMGSMLNLGQYIHGWRATYLKSLLSRNITMEDISNSNYFLLLTSIGLSPLFVIAFWFINPVLGKTFLALTFWNAGITLYILLFVSKFTLIPIDLTQSSGMAVKKVRGAQYIMSFVGLLPTGLLILAYGMKMFNTITYLMVGLGLIGILLRPVIIKPLSKSLERIKYKYIKELNI